MKKIIREFKLGSTKWSVKQVNGFKSSTQLGESSLGEATIRLSKNWCNNKVNKQMMEETLYHEVVHAILDTMAEYDLSANEKFVQNFAVLLRQFEKTKK